MAQLIMQNDYSTQLNLVQALESNGFQVNQGTVSRELKRIGVRKVGGVYRLSAGAKHGVPIHSIRYAQNGALVVLKTQPAFASVLAHRIDAASLPGVLGTIAGDDTVFAAVDDHATYSQLCGFLGFVDAN